MVRKEQEREADRGIINVSYVKQNGNPTILPTPVPGSVWI